MKSKILKIAVTFVLVLIFSVFSVSELFGQTKTGILKIFSEITNTVIYLDEVKQDDGTKVVNDIPVGSHYLKVMSNSVAVYSEIIEIKNGEVTTVLIKNTGNKPVEKTVGKPVENTGVVTFNPNISNVESPINENKPSISSDELKSVPLIKIGQVNGKLSPDMNSIFGLTWGMNRIDTYYHIINQLNGKYMGQGKGYMTFTLDNNTQKPFFLEVRLLDNNRLFSVIVGYVAIDLIQQKVDKLSIPVSDYNEINETLLSAYGQPTSIQRDFTGGYKDGDGREVEAIKKHQAIIKTRWVMPNGNNATLMIAYTKAMIVAVGYENGLLTKEAHDKKIKINHYQY